MDRDCQSGACADGRCAEAKFCATRYLYDALGVDIMLRTYEGNAATLGHHQEPIKCGQCVCEDCPVSAGPGTCCPRRLPHRALSTRAYPTGLAVPSPPLTPPPPLCCAGFHPLLYGHRR